MKKFWVISVALLFVTFLVATSCKDDIVLEPLPSLEGSYEGTYMVITGYPANSPETTISSIEMLFSDESYFFNSDNSPDAFCDPRGDYIISANNIVLTETNKNCTQIAKERDNPRGTFNLRRSEPDSVIMVQLLVPDTLKQFLLTEQ
jgi:hypothetical protein